MVLRGRFIIWGSMHGAALVGHKVYLDKQSHAQQDQARISNFATKFLGIFLTFSWVCLAWIFFRADGLDNAIFNSLELFFLFVRVVT